MRTKLTRVVLSSAVLAISGALTACKPADRAAADSSAIPKDDFGNAISFAARPTRIVSLNPTTTEILFAIGAGSRLVGRSKWDSWPDSAKAVTNVGEAMQPNVESVLNTHPDLVVFYASNDNRAAEGRLRAAGIRTIALRIDSIAQFRRATKLLGRLTGDSARAVAVVDSVDATLDRVRAATKDLKKVTVFFHTWNSPIITIGAQSFLNDLTEIAGGTNVYGDIQKVAPVVTLEDVVKRNPDVMLVGPATAKMMLSSPQWQAVPAVKAKRVFVYDTNTVGRPSVKLGMGAVNIANLLHPGLFVGHPEPKAKDLGQAQHSK
jgi:iron complex transport system substrate-binding protein